MPALSLNGSFDAADDFLQVIYGFGEVVAGFVCLFIAFALLHILRDIVAVLFLLGLEVFETALQLLQLSMMLCKFLRRILFMVVSFLPVGPIGQVLR